MSIQLDREAVVSKYEGLLGIRDAIQETLAEDDPAIQRTELKLELARVVRTLEFMSVDVIQDRTVTS
jgi:hypothetical protein